MKPHASLIESLKHTDEWAMDNYTITHKSSGLVLWTGNGMTMLATHWQSKIALPMPFWRRFVVWPHVQALRGRLFEQAIKK